MARKAREQEFTVKLNIHFKDDPVLLRDITKIILLAIKLAEEKERKEELQKNQPSEFLQGEQNVHGL
ncbi:MAG: hypothetical protein V1762_03950 [Nitrospirota bacterium]